MHHLLDSMRIYYFSCFFLCMYTLLHAIILILLVHFILLYSYSMYIDVHWTRGDAGEGHAPLNT